MRSIRVGPEEHGKFLAACARTPKRMYSCARRSAGPADEEVVAVTFEFRPGFAVTPAPAPHRKRV